jgi:hypothetical protein
MESGKTSIALTMLTDRLYCLGILGAIDNEVIQKH